MIICRGGMRVALRLALAITSTISYFIKAIIFINTPENMLNYIAMRFNIETLSTWGQFCEFGDKDASAATYRRTKTQCSLESSLFPSNSTG